MELVKETNGWKLYKGEKLNEYSLATPEGFLQHYPFYRIETFERAVERGWIWIDKEYFTGTIENGEILVEKRKKQIQSDKNYLFLNNHNITREAVIEKLNPILIEARNKFEICRERLVLLESELNFDVNYTMEGDTHGIHEDYLHISFTIYGVFCKFRIEE